MKKITKDWLISAKSDLLIIEKILEEKDLTHQAAFHAQQAVEKSFKAIIEEFEIGFVKTHSLERLYSLVEKKITIKINTDVLTILDQLYIDARYPGEIGLLPDGKPSIDDSKELYDFAREIYNATKAITI